jgi:hypothetical protein
MLLVRRSFTVVALSTALLACGARAPAQRTVELSPAPTASPAAPPMPSLVAADAGAPPPTDALLPAGLCSFPGYLQRSEGCDGVPAMTHAVLVGDVRSRKEAEALVRKYVGELSPGYPLVLAAHELPLDAEEHQGPEGARRAPTGALLADMPLPRPQRTKSAFRVVAGFFASLRVARTWNAEALSGAGSVHAIAGPPAQSWDGGDYVAFERSRSVAVAIVHPAPAYADADITRAADQVNRMSGDSEEVRWERALAGHKPACAVRAGQVFEADRVALYEQGRRFAPVECEDGRRAWTPWAATRLESVVRMEKEGAFIHQIVDVTCDRAAIERTPYVWGAPLSKGRRTSAGCGHGRS